MERGFGGKKNRVDSTLEPCLCPDVYGFADPRRDRITFVTGNGDYEPVVKKLVADSFVVAVLYWSHASRKTA